MIHLLTPPKFDDEEKTLVAHHLFIIVWTLMAVGWLAILIAVMIPETLYRWLLVIGFIELSGWILLILNRHGYTRLVSNFLIFLIWTAATGMALTGGGTSSNAMAIYFIIVLVAGLLQRGRAVIVTAALCSLTGLFLACLEYSGAMPARQISHTPFTQWIANTIYMAIIISLQYLVSRTIKKALKQSRQEVKERQRVNAALRESEELHAKIMTTMPDIVVRMNLTGEILFVNDVGLRLGGYQGTEMIGQNMLTFIAPEDQERAARNAVLMFERRLGPQEYHLIMKDGRKLLLEVNGDLLRNEDGSPYGMVQVCRDISERKRAEEVLRESEGRFRAMIQSLSDMIFVLDGNGNLTYESPSVSRILGYPPGYFIGKSPLTHIHPDDLNQVVKDLDDVFRSTNDGTPTEFRYRKADGTWVYLEALGSNQLENHGISGVVLTVRDISDRKRAEEDNRRLEERLSRAEKMEALGQLAGGVAHDLNNVLGILSGYSELLLHEIPEGQRSRSHVEKILQSTEKGAAIIQDLLTLARRGVPGSDVINLNSIVSGFLKTPVFEKMKDHHPRVTFRTERDKDLLNIKGSALHLEKTLMNLVSNAAESIPGMGEVTIRTESRYLDKTIGGYDEVREGDYAVLTVSDTGIGIPAENRERIFEPFYTKKKMGRSGTGLGLAIVWGTVKDHNGYIDVETEVGEGTTFTLYFPVTREERIAPREQEPIERYMGHGESVLVVDDIAEQRDIAAQLLTRLGYRVHRVSSGEEAVEFLSGNSADILVLDMIMAPGIDGLETYRRVLEIKPRQKAIIVSGFSETERAKEAQELGAGAYVKKPYTMEKIGVAIRDELIR
jgi:two-component system, cell cycle sensor histidine kinase and response regulator CckA